MSSINRFGSGPSGVQGTSGESASRPAEAPSGGQTGALTDTIRANALRNGPDGIGSIGTGRLSDFTVTAGPGTRQPASTSPGGTEAGAFLRQIGPDFEGKSIANFTAVPH